ncbi:MAG TPA: class I SAM-dependent methyltransferase, partial [Gammaproteobacteria bacterium]
IHPGGRNASVALLRELDPQPGQRILEIGCGTAGTLTRVCRRAPVHAVGLDLLLEMLAQARRRVEAAGIADRVTLLKGAASQIPCDDDSFDSVYCESVLGFQKTPVLRSALREIHRVLKPGGRLIANDAIWKPGVDAELAARINEACEKDFGLMQATESPWHLEDWLREFEVHGFQVDSSELLADISVEEDLPEERANGASSARRFREVVRNMLTSLSPDVIANRLRYRRLLRAYRPVSIHVEGRLFVVTAIPGEATPRS